ncbi:MAG: hypothetical protein DHS20C11_35740 [Lysobacteraceae bacterium]|nr:MAG: hypothetical protein DHS20C11_35740 [Xanthomonadaceae bacterium]
MPDPFSNSAEIWRFRRPQEKRPQTGIKTGFAALDRCLPDGGWRKGCLHEVIAPAPGHGEVGLVMPALASLSQQRRVGLVGTPFTPYPPALLAEQVNLSQLYVIDEVQNSKDVLWAGEQLMRSGTCGGVAVFARKGVDPRSMRRLQLAAEKGGCLGFVIIYGKVREGSSAAAYRLTIESIDGRCQVQVIKARGGVGSGPLSWPCTRLSASHTEPIAAIATQ